ncbi:Lanosterol 14-alpha-demethylase [Cadophora gregata]|uniref:Lanosterol 14-alpha-demethylase n=1 Tax=Cadophora gregata TaxID=51156 RepID=UPI0026DC7F7B|nr:Lanosterol 14-alpha-demethylase [Cadophora gregata]KAK0122072.1 Lanosterol 14-alpha-demethylase [Cadophora gregata]
MTVYLGTAGNEFILNGRLQDVNAEEIYGPLTTPVFGRNIIYDCPNSKLMEQKKFVKFGLTQRALEQHVPLIEHEVLSYISPASTPNTPFHGAQGSVDITHAMAEITIFTAGRALQGAEVRSKLTNEFAVLYDDLDRGFRPINFLMPWAPLPRNWKRDRAHRTMTGVYMDIISRRRQARSVRVGGVKSEIVGRGLEGKSEEDMIDNLMGCTYKSGAPIPDIEIAHLMITLLMAGQHSSSSSSSWIMLRLASRPDIAEELYAEQQANLDMGRGLRYEDLERLPLLGNVVKETLRCHSSIHSLMRKVKNDLPVPGTDYVVTKDKVLVASPIVSHMSEEYFERPGVWDPHRWDTIVADLDFNPNTDAEDKTAGKQGAVRDVNADETVDYGCGTVNKGTKSPYLPFGAGRHRCIGEKFAYVNLCTIVGTLVREFRWSVDEVPRTDYSSLFSRPMPGARVRWERRVKN